MDIMYVYTKRRNQFGRQVYLADKGPELLCDILPNPELVELFIDRDTLDRPIQAAPDLSEHECNTQLKEVVSRGVNHMEGGWPKDINPAEIEQVVRFRKKIERDDGYVASMHHLTETMEQCIKQNNSVDIYELYFGKNNKNNNSFTNNNNNNNAEDELNSAALYYYNNGNLFKRPETYLFNILNCPPARDSRTCTHISWYPESPSKLAVAVCDTRFGQSSENYHSYVWNVNNCLRPEYTFQGASCDITTLEYNPKDCHVVLGGLKNGQLGLFDTRKGSSPFELTQKNLCHREPVSQVVWVASKTGTEFFTGSTDGQVIWWDTRRLDEPLDRLTVEPAKTSTIEGVLCLEYEATLPAKFMVGTDKGHVFLCNKKAKSVHEKIGSTFYTGHVSGIRSLQRSPFSLKNFLTVADTTARIWVEDHKDSSIWSVDYNGVELTGGCFSTNKPGIIFTINKQGYLDTWDLTARHTSPVMSIKASDSALSSIAVAGDMVACGSEKGDVVLYRVNDVASVAERYEKHVVINLLEREARREKMLEGRRREIKNRSRSSRVKSPRIKSAKKNGIEGGKPDELGSCENIFWEVIADEKKKLQNEKQ